MNRLSWLLILADIIGGFDRFLVFLCAAGLIVGAVAVIVGGVCRSDEYSARHDDELYSARHELSDTIFGYARLAVVTAVAAGLLGVLTPSRNTIYAVAASEVGESALDSETGGKAVEALNAWLDRQLSDSPSLGGNS